MPTLQIGRTEIPYELRRSATASERRITVTPGHVEVLALTNDDEEAVAGFLDRKRQWLFNTVREMERITANRHAVPQFMTGSKIPYRGRKMPLTVRRTNNERAKVDYRNGFVVDLPRWAGPNADPLVASELKHWLKCRARRDVKEMVTAYSKRFGLTPRSIRVADFVNGWGSCGREGNVLINWQLIFAPKRVLEYVVAHELAHLRHRNHDAAFWRHLSQIHPTFEESKAWLKKNEGELSAGFLEGEHF
ncbi:SprT family zinc-dependent metalloprotease [Sphingomicrobium sp. XHP0235]|uniref:M48 family metallopeptidase n=1 Tax=Sphingomicrobium aquimarinum TaxID=3133971 RepID=UPI0031FEDBBB